MTGIVLTDRKFSPRSMPPARVPDPAERGEVRVRFTARSAPYLRDERWLVQWVLSFGGEAEVVEPAWARESVSRAALGALEGTR